MADENRAVELQAQLRDMVIPWETGHQLAVTSAVQTVREMRGIFNNFAAQDPYETRKQPELWDLSSSLDETEPCVRAMTNAFMLMLHRRGLLKIDLNRFESTLSVFESGSNSHRRSAAEFDQGQVPTIACINRATTPLGVGWDELIPALDEYANAVFAPIWGTPAKIIDAGTGPDIPPGNWAILFLDDADALNALGYHDLTPEGLPLSKVFVRTTLNDHQKVSVTAARELAEMLVDPGIQMGAIGPDGETWYAYEIADAVEGEELEVHGIAMSNFVYPAWFEAFRAPRSVKFDHLGTCARPFELRPGGYMPVFRNGVWSQIFGSHQAAKRFNSASHPRMWARPRVSPQSSHEEGSHGSRAASAAPSNSSSSASLSRSSGNAY